MTTLFAHDLRTARRKSGLSQRDIATLLETNDRDVSALEAGKRLPNIPQMTKLSIIYNRTFPSLHSMIGEEARRELFQVLPSLPEPRSGFVSKFNRDNTLKRLEKRLVDSITKRDGAA